MVTGVMSHVAGHLEVCHFLFSFFCVPFTENREQWREETDEREKEEEFGDVGKNKEEEEEAGRFRIILAER